LDRVYNDFTREDRFASNLQNQFGAKHCWAEVSSNFVNDLSQEEGGSKIHRDLLNCSRQSYDTTCCVASIVKSESTKRFYRVVTNLNSREAGGRAMENETKKISFKLDLTLEMERISSSYKDLFGECAKVPLAERYQDFYLNDSLPFKEEQIGTQSNQKNMLYITAASAPSRHYFLSLAASTIYDIRFMENCDLDLILGLLLIALYQNQFHHFHCILMHITEDDELCAKMIGDLPQTYYKASELLFLGKFCSGIHPRFHASGFSFREVFVENKNNFGTAVTELKESLKIVHNLEDTAALIEIISQVSYGAKLPHISIFRLQLFLPLAALCGLVLSDKLFLADVIQPSPEMLDSSCTNTPM
jgi:hypothetical protein